MGYKPTLWFVLTRPDACPSHLHHLSHDLDALHGTPWLLVMDGNVPMTSGPWDSAMNLVGACLRAIARHVCSSEPIDGIWSSENCFAVPNSSTELPATGGDHTVAQVFEVPSVGTEWRLARTPQESRQTEVRSLPWAQVASADSEWQQALLSIDTAWNQWCSDIQAWLELAGVVFSSNAERPLGSTPSTRHGNHKIASREGCAERNSAVLSVAYRKPETISCGADRSHRNFAMPFCAPLSPKTNSRPRRSSSLAMLLDLFPTDCRFCHRPNTARLSAVGKTKFTPPVVLADG